MGKIFKQALGAVLTFNIVFGTFDTIAGTIIILTPDAAETAGNTLQDEYTFNVYDDYA